MFKRLIKPFPLCVLALLFLPIAGGLVGVVLPAFGWFPALGGRSLNLHTWQNLFAQTGLWTMVNLSLLTGLISAIIALIITALLLSALLDTKWLMRLQKILSPLLSVPHASVAIGVAFLFAPSGLFTRLISPELTQWQQPPDWLFPGDTLGIGMIIGLVIKEMPFLLLMALASLKHCNAIYHHRLARSLGYSPITAFFKAVWPTLYPLLRLPMMAVIVYATSSVEMAIILGPSTPAPLSAMILRWFSDPDLTMRFQASAGALLQLGVSIFALMIYFGLEKLLAIFSKTQLTNGKRHYADGVLSAIASGVSLLLFGLLIIGLLGLVMWSFAGFWQFPDTLPSQFITQNWSRSLPVLSHPIYQALWIGILSTLIATAVTLLMLEAQSHHPLPRMAHIILYLPLIVPAIAFLFGIVWLQEWAGITAGFWPVVAVHVIFVLPYVYLSVATHYQTLDARWSAIAHSLGANTWRVFWSVRIPLLTVPILSAVAVGLAVSFGQYLPTLLVGGGRVNTITLEAVSMATGGSRRLTAVYALMQMLLPMLAFFIAINLPKWVLHNRRNLVLNS